MTMTAFWWVLFVGTLGSLTYNVVAARRRAARGEPTPWYVAGNIPGAIGMLCLISSYLVGIDSWLAMFLLAASFVFLGLDIAASLRARRRDSRRAT
jgi:hypothetical protein